MRDIIAAPFGTDIGGVNPAFFPVAADAEFDSWITIGPTDGSAGAAVAASPGLGLDAWTETTAFSTENGAIFWMSPDQGPTGSGIVVAQITSTTATGSASAFLQGRSVGEGVEDWTAFQTWEW